MKIIVFGTQRIGAIWALRNQVRESDVVRASNGVEGLRGINGPLHLVRVHPDVWEPYTYPDIQRTQELEVYLKDLKKSGRVITEETME